MRQAIPVEFVYNFTPEMASLFDSSSDSRDVKELPLWLVKKLFSGDFARVSNPKIFSKTTQGKNKGTLTWSKAPPRKPASTAAVV